LDARRREEGPALLERLHGDGTDIPVIFYAGHAGPERRARAAELGAVTVTEIPDELLRFALVELSTAR
jgi:CheY-like chemotaxis protein